MRGELPTSPTLAKWTAAAGPVAGSTSAIATDGEVLVVVRDSARGLYRSVDHGVTWTGAGAGLPFPPRGDGSSAVPTGSVLAAREKEIFLGTQVGAYSSRDGGLSWSTVDTGLADSRVTRLGIGGGTLVALAGSQPYEWDAARRTWSALGPAQPFGEIAASGPFVFASTASSGQVFRRKAGSGWAAVPLPAWGYDAFAVMGNVVFASRAEDMSRSRDGGGTWTPLNASKLLGSIRGVFQARGVLFARTPSRLWQSSDQGESWTIALDGGQGGTATGVVSDGKAFFLAADRLYRSKDAVSWSAVDTFTVSTPERLFATDKSLIAVTEEGNYVSFDTGKSWAAVSGLPDPGARFRRFAARGSTVYAATDPSTMVWPIGFVRLGVLYRSVDGGASWQPLARKLPADAENFPVTALEATADGLVVATGSGSSSEAAPGVYRSIDEGESWRPANDGLPVHVDTAQGTRGYRGVVALRLIGAAMWISTEDGHVFRSEPSDDGRVGWSDVTSRLGPALGAPITYFVPFGNSILALSSFRPATFVRTVDGGEHWAALATGLPASARLDSIASEGGRLVVLVRSGASLPEVVELASITGGAPVWTPLAGEVPGVISSLALQGGDLFAGVVGRAVWTHPMARCMR